MSTGIAEAKKEANDVYKLWEPLVATSTTNLQDLIANRYSVAEAMVSTPLAAADNSLQWHSYSFWSNVGFGWGTGPASRDINCEGGFVLRRHLRRQAFLAASLVATAISEAQSQDLFMNPSAAQVAISLRTRGHPGGALAILTQARGVRSTQQMDEIADTLVSIAATFSGAGTKAVSTRLAAMEALMFAGIGQTGINDGAGGVPYRGAAVRLQRLAESAQDPGVRVAAVLSLVRLPDSVAYLPFLAKVATRSDEVATQAVGLLVRDLGAAGRAIARDLFVRDVVTNWSARNILEGAAARYDWRR